MCAARQRSVSSFCVHSIEHSVSIKVGNTFTNWVTELQGRSFNMKVINCSRTGSILIVYVALSVYNAEFCEVETAHVHECTTIHVTLISVHMFCDQTDDSCKITLFQVTIVVNTARKNLLCRIQWAVNKRTVFVPMYCFHSVRVTYF
jgi:hypothetical protein